MSIPAALIKGGLGLGVLGAGATGVYYLSNKAPAATQEETVLDKSKYDQALIDFLDKGDEYDIVFDVKKGSNGNGTDLTSDDPDLTTNPINVKVQVTTSGSTSSSANLKKGSESATGGDIKAITDLNGGTWTWSCQFVFEKDSTVTDDTTIKNEIKGRIYKTGDLGLFGILKKPLHSYSDPADNANNTKWTKASIKEVKKDFIKKCAEARGSDKNKALNSNGDATTNLAVVVPKFTFIKETPSGGSTAHLIPKTEDTERFNQWFDAKYGTKTYS